VILLLALVQAAALRGEVVDAESGRAVPCRIYVQGSDGRFHHVRSDGGTAVPYSRERQKGSIEVHTTISAHPFSAELPPGEYTLTVERGKEYLPETSKLALGAEGAKVPIKLRRFADAAARGWFSGETHVHRPLEELPALVLAEDLNVAFPLSYWVTTAFDPPKKGKASVEQDPEPALIAVDERHVIWPRNTEYEIFTVGGKSHTLGAFFVLGHKALLERGVPPVRPSVESARKEGALLELDKHNWPWSMMLVPVLGVDLFELANNHHWRTEFGFRQFAEREPAWMKVERDERGFTELGWTEFGLVNYYALLDCGFRMRPTAGSASGVHPVPLGFGRVYVRTGPRFSYDAWMKGLNEGRSFATTGPLLYVRADDQDPGHVFRGAREIRISGVAESAAPLGRLEVVVNGELARALKPANLAGEKGGFASVFDVTLPIDGSSWIAVRCFEERPDKRVRFAHSAPWHVEVDGKPLRPRREEVEYLVARVEAELKRHEGVLPEAALEEYRDALKVYRSKLDGAR
jgi:hypothetical protein